MINVHLRIHYGGEERFDMVRRTIEVSYPYFKTVRVTNFGPDENAHRFNLLTAKISNLTVVNYGRQYYQSITEDLLRSHVMDVPDGEWVAWLDSDWRFPQYFLDHMQDEIAICENGGFNHLYSYQLGHTLDDRPFITPFGHKKIFHMTKEDIDIFVNYCYKNPSTYGWPVLQKVDKKNLWLDSFYGNHTYYLHVPYNKREVPEMYHLHFRHFDPDAYCGTMLYQHWWYIGHNVFSLDAHECIMNSKEFKQIEDFKHKHHCYTSNELRVLMKTNKSFLDELKILFLSFENTNIFACKQMYNIACHDMKIWSTPSESECNGVCCQYKSGKIFNI